MLMNGVLSRYPAELAGTMIRQTSAGRTACDARRMSEPIGPPDASKSPRYAGISTFARLPQRHEVSSADVSVVGIPFDSGVSYRPGARFGPAHIRQSSRLLRPYNPALDVAPFAGRQVVDAGDIAANPFHIGEAIATIEAAARELTRESRVLTLGGDHTIALPLLRAHHAMHGELAGDCPEFC